jgi:hypothetical protein
VPGPYTINHNNNKQIQQTVNYFEPTIYGQTSEEKKGLNTVNQLAEHTYLNK